MVLNCSKVFGFLKYDENYGEKTSCPMPFFSIQRCEHFCEWVAHWVFHCAGFVTRFLIGWKSNHDPLARSKHSAKHDSSNRNIFDRERFEMEIKSLFLNG